MERKPRKSQIRSLPQDQQDHIWNLLQNHTYPEASQILSAPKTEGGLGISISTGMLWRFFARRGQQETVEELPEIKESADAWLHYKETGETGRFDEAARERLKLRTFELSGTLKYPKELTQLKSLFAILFAARLADVRERTAAVRERAITLRETESQHRRDREEKKASPRDKRNPSKPGSENNSQSAPDSNAAARVIQHCGGASGFVGQSLPDETLPQTLRRLHKEIQDGTFRPLAPGEPPRYRVPGTKPYGEVSRSATPVGPVSAPGDQSSAGILPAGSGGVPAPGDLPPTPVPAPVASDTESPAAAA